MLEHGNNIIKNIITNIITNNIIMNNNIKKNIIVIFFCYKLSKMNA
jgi:hypothetical protein